MVSEKNVVDQAAACSVVVSLLPRLQHILTARATRQENSWEIQTSRGRKCSKLTERARTTLRISVQDGNLKVSLSPPPTGADMFTTQSGHTLRCLGDSSPL
jgi:hypothetical protein